MMEGNQYLRLECLKLAVQNGSKHSVENPVALAETYYGFVTQPEKNEPEAAPEKNAPGKSAPKADARADKPRPPQKAKGPAKKAAAK